MADAAIVRREARRRKILENSHNRLQIISGKNVNETWKESSIITPILKETAENSVPKDNIDMIERLLNNGVINAGEESFSFLSTNHESFAFGDGDVTTLSDDAEDLISPNATPKPDSTQVELFTNYIHKFDIVLLSWFLQLLHYFALISFEGTYFFLPLILYNTTKYFWIPKEHNSTLANVLLLLNGMSASNAQKIMNITQYVSSFSQDVCVFLFTTICCQSFLQTIEVLYLL